MELRRGQQTIEKTGPQPSALAPIPPLQKVPRRRGLLGVVEGKKAAQSAMREQGRNMNRTGIASLPHVKLAPMSAPGPTGERQEHLHAIVSFAEPARGGACFGDSTFSTIKWATGDLLEECRIRFNTQLVFLKKKKDKTSKGKKSPPRSQKTTSCMISRK